MRRKLSYTKAGPRRAHPRPPVQAPSALRGPSVTAPLGRNACPSPGAGAFSFLTLTLPHGVQKGCPCHARYFHTPSAEAGARWQCESARFFLTSGRFLFRVAQQKEGPHRIVEESIRPVVVARFWNLIVCAIDGATSSGSIMQLCRQSSHCSLAHTRGNRRAAPRAAEEGCPRQRP